MRKLLEVNGVKNGGIYIQATRGASPREHSFPTPPVKPVLMAFTKSYDRPFDDLEKVSMLLQQKIFVGYVVTLKV